ncbi:MAG: hypothetical protein ACR2FY_17550 [Pirellulaceae bacterium]
MSNDIQVPRPSYNFVIDPLAALGAFLFRWVLAIVLIVFPPIYLAYNPQHWTPLVDSLFSVFLFLLAFWIGTSQEIYRASRRANDRWLPQAESVIFRLMTLRANVARFAVLTRDNCDSAACDLPELNQEAMRPVRIKIKGDCEAASQRLSDIGFQLEDAISDWRRFIVANCYENECSRILDALEQRELRLAEEGIYVSEFRRPSPAASPPGADQ